MSVWEFRMWLEEMIPMWVALLPLVILLVVLLVKKWRGSNEQETGN